MSWAGVERNRSVSGAFIVALLNYVERAAGPTMAERVLKEAGCKLSLDELRACAWGSRDELLDAAAGAAALLGEPEIGRRTGEELYRMTVADKATRAFFTAAGSPAAALECVLEYTVKMGRGRAYTVVSSDHSSCVIEGDYLDRKLGHPFFCGLSLGYWPAIASLFGAVGTAHHPECQCRGDGVCTFVIRWDPGAGAGDSTTQAADAELERRIGTFERMQAVAADLARAADLPNLAERILDAVDVISPAPGLLVAIRTHPRKRPIVAWRGLNELSARALADDLLDGTHSGEPTITAMAALDDMGVVATIAPDGRSASATSSRMLEAFARHAGARIEAVLAREQAEESRLTSTALLQLARSLAEATSEQDVSECLAQAIPPLVGSEHSTVLRWHPDTYLLETVAYIGPDGRTPCQEYSVNQVPGIFDLATRRSPFVLDRSTAAPYLASAMADWNERFDVIVPLVEQGDFLGFVSAGFHDEIGLDRETAFARLQGAADLAATAYTNARLLDEVRHQALHDDLTGLPNRALLEDRARQSLQEARRNSHRIGVLFLDLDRFKNVNDSLGHEFGDGLIQAAATRIRGALREGDVFARMGGDEFVIVLQDIHGPDDATAVATKILDDLRQPFEISGQSLYTSASIGVAIYPDDGEDFGALLHSADSSMYAAKGAGRDKVSRLTNFDTAGFG